ncbi:MAG TPA: S9 family peptidase [Elusimicrobia bacterium]|nr:S9 family peptidase [Elusimicrobiota bacterium]
MRHAIIAGAMLSLMPVQLAAKDIPLRDFFRNPEKAGFDVSPDGKTLSFLAPYKRRMNLFLQERGSTKARRITKETERDITGGYFWKGGGRLVYFKDFKGDENFHPVAVSRKGGAPKDLTPFPGVKAELVDELRDSEDEFLIGMNRRKKEIFDVYRLNAASGTLALVAENPGNVTRWLSDHKGKLRAAVTSDGVNTTLLFREGEGEPFRPVLTTSFKESFTPLFFTFDDRRLYGFSNIGRDKSALVEFDPASGKESALVYEHPDVDLEDVNTSRKRKVLLEALFVTAKQGRKVFDPEYGALIEDLERRLPDWELRLTGADKAEEALIFRASNDRSRGAYYLYETAGKKLTKLADLSPWLAEGDLAEMKPVSYASRDGLTINGYLTVPPGRVPKGLPVVVNPHGGPWYRDVWRFNPEVQFLASRGYAVLQVNFRGSTGYGRKFWEASFKQWGRKMQDDVSDGVAYLVKEGIADPKRVAIYGGSYGGYATLAGLAFTPELYACGVDYVGVSNLFTFLKSIPPYWKPYLEMLYEMVGDPEKDKDLLAAASPVFHAGRIRAPLLVAQGAKDPRVNIDESNQIVEGLRKRGVQVEYLVKENEGHGFHNEENRFEFYQAMEKFLAGHMK